MDTNEKLKIELLRESNEAISDEIAANKSRCLRILEEWPELAKICAVPIKKIESLHSDISKASLKDGKMGDLPNSYYNKLDSMVSADTFLDNFTISSFDFMTVNRDRYTADE